MAEVAVKPFKEFFQEKLVIRGFDFVLNNSDIVAWPKGDEESSVYFRWHEPGAYSVRDGEGVFKDELRQRMLQSEVVYWVYEYYAGGIVR